MDTDRWYGVIKNGDYWEYEPAEVVVKDKSAKAVEKLKEISKLLKEVIDSLDQV